MDVIFILIGASILLAGGFLVAFIISSRRGQFNDTYTPSVRMLFDEGTSETDNKKNNDKVYGDRLNGN